MSGRADTGGLTTALALLGAAGGGAGADSETQQADMFEAPAPLPLPVAPRADAGKAGRPKGARNRSTDEWVRYFLGQYRSPLTGLAELYTRPLGELVDDLQAMADKHKTWRETKDGGHWERVAVSPLEVLRLQRDAMVALLPYIHKRQPMALEVDQRMRGIVVLGSLDTAGADVSDDLALPLPPFEENQQVTGATDGQSDGSQSDGDRSVNAINRLGPKRG